MSGWSGGVFTRARNWVTDKLNTINPQASLFDQEDDNFAAGLNNCVTKDGLNKPTATMDFNSQRLAGLAAPTTAGDAIRVESAAATFTGTLTGMSGATTGTVSYFLTNNMVYLFVGTSIFGTSNSSGMTMTGLPVAIRPAATRNGISAFGSDNGNPVMMSHSVSAAGVVTFSPFLAAVFTTWTTSGVKGLQGGFVMSYPL